jgi:SAM-dependent methyltransferase
MAFGPLLQWCRTVHLDKLRDCKRALILGDGDGRFLVELLKANPEVVVDSIDSSRGMLKLALNRVSETGHAARVRFIEADACVNNSPEHTYDLIVTNFFLDCFTPKQLKPLVERVAAAATLDAIWLEGDFRIPARGWPRKLGQAVVSAMYLFFAFATRLRARWLIEPAPLLEAREFRLRSELSRLSGFLSSRLWVRESTNGDRPARK